MKLAMFGVLRWRAGHVALQGGSDPGDDVVGGRLPTSFVTPSG
jgi:hypothetical protein